MSVQKKPTIQEWFTIVTFGVQQLKLIFASKQFKGRLAKQNEDRIIILEQQNKEMFDVLQAQAEINVLQEGSISELKAEVEKLQGALAIIAGAGEPKTSSKKGASKAEPKSEEI